MYFRHDIYIYDMCISNMTSTFMTAAFLRLDINIYDMCISDMISTLMTSVFWRQVIYIYNISVFLDMASTFMTFMFFRHDISIDDISVFHMTSRFMTSVYFTWYQMKNKFIYRWMTKTKNSFNNRTVTFLQLNDDNTTIGPLVLERVLICITYLLLTLATHS